MNATLTQKRREMASRLLHVNGRITTLAACLPYQPRHKAEIDRLIVERRHLMANMPTVTACIS